MPPSWPDLAERLGGLDAFARATQGEWRVEDAERLLGEIEDEVQRAPEVCLRLDADGRATLHAAGQSYTAGRFSTPTLAELRRAAEERTGGRPGHWELSILTGAHAFTDVGTLQAVARPRTLFQVASQFNALESPGPFVVPVRKYTFDPTQGPRASVSAFPGTFLRHYSEPDGRNLLRDAFDATVATVVAGYLQIRNVRDEDALAHALTKNFDQVRMGVHEDVEVVFGHGWAGPVPTRPQRISQVFTSAMALGGYGRDHGSSALATARRQILKAAYLGTLLAAIRLDCGTVVLTLIGGGVFGNPHEDIWAAIRWALGETEALAGATRQAVVNCFSEPPPPDEDLQARVCAVPA